jgi:hypothetical protein
LGVLLVSPARGFIWYSPVVILGLYGLWRLRRQPLALGGLTVLVALLVIYIGNPGSNPWGSRYLVPALPLVCAALGTLTGRTARLAVALGLVGFLISLPTIPAFYERYYKEKPAGEPAALPPPGPKQWRLDQGGRYWQFPGAAIIGMWPTAVRQVKEASRTDVRTHFTPEAGLKRRGAPGTEANPLFQVIALWWWFLPRAGIPAWIGASFSLLAVGVGLSLLARESLGRAPLSPKPPA